MKGYKINIVGNSDQELDAIEMIRKQAFHLKPTGENHYKKHIREGKMIPFSMEKEDGEMIGGCYLGEYRNSIYVYFLFLKPEYQKSGLQLGRKLLLEVLKHKKEIEEILHQSFDTSSLHPNCDKVKEVYESIGYKEESYGYYIKKI